MLMPYKRGQGSVIIRVKILNSSLTTNAGLTGLSSSSSGLIIAVTADNEQPPAAGSGAGFGIAYTSAGSTVEGIATLGTFAAPTPTKCRFKEFDPVNHKGWYELQIADARFAVVGSKSVGISISGPTNCAETDFVIPLQDLDPYLSAKDSVWAQTMSELASIPGMTDSVLKGLTYLFSISSNKVTQSSISMGVYKSDDTPLGSAVVTDDGAVFTRNRIMNS